MSNFCKQCGAHDDDPHRAKCEYYDPEASTEHALHVANAERDELPDEAEDRNRRRANLSIALIVGLAAVTSEVDVITNEYLERAGLAVRTPCRVEDVIEEAKEKGLL